VKRPIAALLAYAAGVVLLQACPRLPPAAGWLFASAAFLAASTLLLARRAARRPDRHPARAARIHAIAMLASMVTCGLCGFAYAAWRAEMRLADQLPPAWEERDIRITGVVDDLPHDGPQGTRFAFAVMRIETSGASWRAASRSLGSLRAATSRRRMRTGHRSQRRHRSCTPANAGR